jgi:two-component system chemotaxis response regulator CheB
MVPAFKYEIVVIGASVGGIGAVSRVLSALPCNFGVPIVVVQHLGSKIQGESELPQILAGRTPLLVKWAEEGEQLASSSRCCLHSSSGLSFGGQFKAML